MVVLACFYARLGEKGTVAIDTDWGMKAMAKGYNDNDIKGSIMFLIIILPAALPLLQSLLGGRPVG